ncbi:MAG TPA: T9SS type A sorting domain-containing protein [Bacteroidales bacterium]|jgi:hypothetical protein|nr:T9SS type A sorting domain-containing protein [Bacteroidales bacterium]MBP7873504.1 T9SS type A sorting domain-containing protein [Bacteroidales bacterium]MCZ2281661.1 T9SS type A sorting domain-containing protein [Bacteroidales bacterium]HOF80240.1 T9SS type A sorting domain-containing protein [Bacteroidales bacterium]HPX33559.1 T9SS type A sorting domain-containing protein [Bacteroidales bacterium]
MKKVLLVVLSFCLVTIAYSQKRVPISKELTKMSLTRVYEMPSDLEAPMVNFNYTYPGLMKEAKMLGDEAEIIETIYDLQTNSTVANRFVVWDDGTMAAVCTRGVESPGGFAFPDRGTGYNYFDGSSWGPKPSTRIESKKAGWPSITKWGANGEFVVSHQGGGNPLLLLKRETKGTGAWIESTYNGPNGTAAPQYLWPRMISSGQNNEYIHLFALTAPTGNGGTPYMGQDGALLYNRSTDGGESWDIQHQLIDGVGSDYYLNIRADDYTMAFKGNTVALLQSSAWKDLFLLKSTDNGESWEKIIIWEHPYPFFDVQSTLTSDTLYSVDQSASLAIDDNGMVHVVWGISRVARLESAPPDPGSYSYWPYTDGIGYWNESMGQIPEADNPHRTMMPEYLEEMGMLVGWTQDVNNSGFIFDFEGTNDTPFNAYRSLGISTMPTIAIEGSMIMVAYSSVTETYVTADGTMNYKHIWTRFSYDLGETWGDFYDLQGDNIFHLYDECIYPILADKTNGSGAFQLIYQADNLPGLYLDEDHDAVVNRVIHNNMNFTVGIEKPANMVSPFKVTEAYPNPATSSTIVGVELDKAANIGFEIFNMTGQKVFELPVKSMNAGFNTISFDVSALTSGIYFYTVSNGAEKVSHKLIVK